MASKKKSKRALQRSRNKKRRERHGPLIGYDAHHGLDAVCDGDALVVAGSEAQMRHIIGQLPGNRNSTRYHIRATTSDEILAGMRHGGAYCFDEQAYGRFLQPARQAGMALDDEDFSFGDPGPRGIHLVRVQYFGLL